MTEQDLILKTENLIKSVPQIREQVGLIDKEISQYNAKIETLNEEVQAMNAERAVLTNKIKKLKNIMDILSEEEQKIICYKYFEEKNNADINRLLGRSSGFCNKKKVNDLLFIIGKGAFVGDIIVYGLEEE